MSKNCNLNRIADPDSSGTEFGCCIHNTELQIVPYSTGFILFFYNYFLLIRELFCSLGEIVTKIRIFRVRSQFNFSQNYFHRSSIFYFNNGEVRDIMWKLQLVFSPNFAVCFVSMKFYDTLQLDRNTMSTGGVSVGFSFSFNCEKPSEDNFFYRAIFVHYNY